MPRQRPRTCPRRDFPRVADPPSVRPRFATAIFMTQFMPDIIEDTALPPDVRVQARGAVGPVQEAPLAVLLELALWRLTTRQKGREGGSRFFSRAPENPNLSLSCTPERKTDDRDRRHAALGASARARHVAGARRALKAPRRRGAQRRARENDARTHQFARQIPSEP